MLYQAIYLACTYLILYTPTSPLPPVSSLFLFFYKKKKKNKKIGKLERELKNTSDCPTAPTGITAYP